jgi:ribosome biogenesis GTPase
MAQRKLNRRQQWRVEKIQLERQQRLEKKLAQANQAIDPGSLGTEEAGLVIANYGASLEIQDQQGHNHRCLLRQNLPALVVGDRVIWQRASEGGVVTAQLPRDSELARPDANDKPKAVAANIDQILVVAAPAPEYSTDLIDQYLVAAELTGVTPTLIFNKIDLIDSNNRQSIETILNRYRQIGYTVLTASTVLEQGLQALRAQLQDHTSVFVGQSGVGKSSLIRAFIPRDDIAIGPLSQQSGLGQHTTSTSRLYHLADGGNLIDSPGVRDFRLWSVSPAKLLGGFRELAPYQGLCKFRDCSHRHEPGCALRTAVEEGKISAERLQSYHRLAAQMQEPSWA